MQEETIVDGEQSMSISEDSSSEYDEPELSDEQECLDMLAYPESVGSTYDNDSEVCLMCSVYVMHLIDFAGSSCSIAAPRCYVPVSRTIAPSTYSSKIG